MNYRHIYHAGNFADVVKHITLIALLDALLKKDTPFCYLDTHAGAGCYDLQSDWANKTKEYSNGIEKIMTDSAELPSLVSRYVDYIRTLNLSLTNEPTTRYYPGSPLIARHFSRSIDRIITCELQIQQFEALKINTGYQDKKITMHHMDGFLGLKALLPPLENRGLIFIDPPFEAPDEFNQIIRSLSLALRRFARGVYVVWYPIKEKIILQKFYRSLESTIKFPILITELSIYPDLPYHLNGCGLMIINPPWMIDQTLNNILPWLWKTLSINDQGNYRCFSLNSDKIKV